MVWKGKSHAHAKMGMNPGIPSCQPGTPPPTLIPPFTHRVRGTSCGKIVAGDFGVKIRDIGVRIRYHMGKRETTQKRRLRDDTIYGKTVAFYIIL